MMETIEFRIDVLPTNLTLNEFRKAGKYTDVTINGFACHKCELAAACEFFDELFYPVFEDGNKDYITLDEFDKNDVFGKIIDLIYRGIVQIDVKQLDTFLAYSDKLKLRYLQLICIRCIQQNLHIPNFSEMCLRFILRGDGCNNKTPILIQYLAKNISSSWQCPSFKNLPFSYLKEIFHTVATSGSKFFFSSAGMDMLKNWLYTDFEKRFIHLQTLLNFFPEMIRSEVWEKVITSEKFSYVTLKENTKKIVTVEASSEKGALEMYVQFQECENREMGLLGLGLSKNNEWVALTRDNKEIKYPTVDHLKTVSILNRKYVFTYESGENKFWTDFYEEKNLLTKPSATFRTFSLAPIKNYIYLCGDTASDEEEEEKLHMFNIETGVWSECASPTGPKSVLLPIDSSVLGIINSRQIFLYDHRMHRFIQVPKDRPDPTDSFGACVYNGDIHICGGYESYYGLSFPRFGTLPVPPRPTFDKFPNYNQTTLYGSSTFGGSPASITFGSPKLPAQSSSNLATTFNFGIPKTSTQESDKNAAGASGSFKIATSTAQGIDKNEQSGGLFGGTNMNVPGSDQKLPSQNLTFGTFGGAGETPSGAFFPGPATGTSKVETSKKDSKSCKRRKVHLCEKTYVKKSSHFNSLDLRNYEWSSLKQMPSGRANHFLIPYNNKLWVMDRKLKGEVYNPVCKDWDSMPAIPSEVEVNSRKYQIMELEDVFTY